MCIGEWRIRLLGGFQGAFLWCCCSFLSFPHTTVHDDDLLDAGGVYVAGLRGEDAEAAAISATERGYTHRHSAAPYARDVVARDVFGVPVRAASMLS
jgi:hypothetical protein